MHCHIKGDQSKCPRRPHIESQVARRRMVFVNVFLDICREAHHPAVSTRSPQSLLSVEVHLCMALQSEFPGKSLVTNPADKWLQQCSLSVRAPSVLPQCRRIRKFHFTKSAHFILCDGMRPFVDTQPPITPKRFSAAIGIEAAFKWFGVTESVSVQILPPSKCFAASLGGADKPRLLQSDEIGPSAISLH